jgi:hypothetical protein
MRARFWLPSAFLLVLVVACTGMQDEAGVDAGSKPEPDSSEPPDLGSGGSTGTSPCEEGCVLTVAAACPNGPADVDSCIATCESLRNGACGAPYRAFQECGEDKPVTCDPASEIPTIEGCATEQAAFVDCVNR